MTNSGQPGARSSLRRAVPRIGLAAAALALLWVGFGGLRGVRLVEAEAAVAATELRLAGLAGDEVTLDSYRGRVVLLSAWAGWCPPCRAEIPRLNRLQAELGPRGLIVLGVNVERLEPAELARQVERLGIDYPVVVPSGAIDGAFEWRGVLPTTWLIDRRGRVRAFHEGLPTERSLRRACEQLLGDAS